ncbi:MAG: hypothetical protein U5L03_08810 [Burkholderiaceae bacterium]|nr:hypothetical protein [Burkholderiaceae bacterium]
MAVKRAASVLSLAAMVLAGSPSARACGYHDPLQLNRGMLNLSYPESLHVHTAVWMAQLDGTLPRRDASATSDEQPEMLRAMLAYRNTVRTLEAARARLESGQPHSAKPPIAVLLIGPMLWVRFEQAEARLQMVPHVDGPARGDVVVITDAPVMAALVDGSMTAGRARAMGLVRYYGAPQGVEQAAATLDQLTPIPNENSLQNAAVESRPSQ